MNIYDLEKQEQELSATLSDVRKRLKELRAKKWEDAFNVKIGDIIKIINRSNEYIVFLKDIGDMGSFCRLSTNPLKKDGSISKNIKTFYADANWPIVKVEQ